MDASSQESGDRNEKIRTLRDVANIDSDEEAKRRLEHVGWDLQQAVEMFLTGREVPLSVSPRDRAPQAASGNVTIHRSNGGPDAEQRRSPWRALLRLLFLPVRAAISLVSFISSAISRFLGIGQNLVEQESPRDATIRFLSRFEEQYGNQHPPFFRGPYVEALRAAERQYKVRPSFWLLFVFAR